MTDLKFVFVCSNFVRQCLSDLSVAVSNTLPIAHVLNWNMDVVAVLYVIAMLCYKQANLCMNDLVGWVQNNSNIFGEI